MTHAAFNCDLLRIQPFERRRQCGVKDIFFTYSGPLSIHWASFKRHSLPEYYCWPCPCLWPPCTHLLMATKNKIKNQKWLGFSLLPVSDALYNDKDISPLFQDIDLANVDLQLYGLSILLLFDCGEITQPGSAGVLFILLFINAFF